MKKLPLIILVIAGFALGIIAYKTAAADLAGFQVFEYATIRWAGRENTHLIRSNGKVEFLSSILTRFPRPDRVDERAFYMNIALNAASKEGYELTAMTHDEMVLRRELPRE